jgi:ribosomal protein S18 acetylase RimI-like enzyme
VEIREALPEEFPEVGETTLRAYVAGAGASEPYRPRLLDVAGRAESCTVLLAVDGAVLGTVTYVPGPGTPLSEFADGDAAGMRMLAVDPDARGRGIGRALAEACIERARRDGRRRLVIHARPEMAAARHIYEALGFRRDPARDFEPLPGVALLGYVLDLEALSVRPEPR